MRLIRGIVKNKFFFALNVLGLSVAMSAFMMIAQYTHFERSYEDFVPDAGHIFRVSLDSYSNNQLVTSTAENYPGVGPAMMDIAGVDSYARLYNLGYKNNVVITNEEANPPVAIKQQKFLYADSAFLPMMGYHLSEGDVTTALAAPNTAVITKEIASIYFGNAEAVGKMLHMHDDDENDEVVRVTGVLEMVPKNTHLKFDVLFSYKTLLNRGRQDRPGYAKAMLNRFEGWSRNDMYTYIHIAPGADPASIEAQLPGLVKRFRRDSEAAGDKTVLHLQPLADIHLKSKLAEEWEVNGNENSVSYLLIIGIFVLVIGWINYVNLSTARAMDRAKEVGVYKVMGAFRHELVIRFLAESAVVNAISMVIAFAIVSAALPVFNSISGLMLEIDNLLAPWFLGLSAMLWLLGTCLSGFYPAIVLSGFKPAAVLKGKLQRTSHGAFLRKTLVVAQFTASVALISGTLIIYRQLNHMMSGNVGMDIDQIMVMSRPGIGAPRTGKSSMDAFRNNLRSNPAIEAVTGSSTIPGMLREYKNPVKRYGASDEQAVSLRLNSMDYEFNDVFNMKVIAGRVFSQSYPKDKDTAVVITESAVKALGFKSPDDAIGQTLTLNGWDWNPIVVGVVNDYHQQSFKERLEPTLFYCDPYEGEYYSLKVKTSDLPSAIDFAKTAWEKSFPGNPFQFFFLDDYFNRQYNNEKRFGELFTVFAVMALLIGCVGLFGLASYTTSQRTKEIGIRKVLGSSVASLFVLLTKDYVKLILVSVAIGVPIVYSIMSGWLEGFAYHITIPATIFISAGIAVLVIALLTISIQTIKSALSNPVDALRYE
jgi:putative ABC transport system permease protein